MRYQICNLLLGLFGRICVKLGQWPHGDIVTATIAAIREAGGLDWDGGGSPAGEVEKLYFRLHGRRVCLSIEDYGDVTLWGPKDLVRHISRRIAEGPPVADPPPGEER
jgi:hypothetical protein